MIKDKKPKIILAIDPGYGRCGWAVLEKNFKTNLIACDCIETCTTKCLDIRLKEIYDSVKYLIKKYKPNCFAIESLFWFKNQKTALAVAQARGVIILAATKNNLKIVEFTPLQVKNSVVGYGKASKDQVLKMLKYHLKDQHTPIQDDTADAVAIGLTFLQNNNY